MVSKPHVDWRLQTGKLWLRSHVLARDGTIAVQCQVESTPELLFQQALGLLGIDAELTTTKTNTLQGTLDLRGNIELGKLLAKTEGEVRCRSVRRHAVCVYALCRAARDIQGSGGAGRRARRPRRSLRPRCGEACLIGR